MIETETQLAKIIYRTQLFEPKDIENAKKIQAGYGVRPLSTFLVQPRRAPAPPIDFMRPLPVDEMKSSLEIINVINFVLQFCPTHPSEKSFMERFAKIGIGPYKRIDVSNLPRERRRALQDGIADAWQEFAVLKARIDAKELASGDAFGTREALKNDYLVRMVGDVLGIYGNSKEEAMYPAYLSVDEEAYQVLLDQLADVTAAPKECRWRPDTIRSARIAVADICMYCRDSIIAHRRASSRKSVSLAGFTAVRIAMYRRFLDSLRRCSSSSDDY